MGVKALSEVGTDIEQTSDTIVIVEMKEIGFVDRLDPFLKMQLTRIPARPLNSGASFEK